MYLSTIIYIFKEILASWVAGLGPAPFLSFCSFFCFSFCSSSPMSSSIARVGVGDFTFCASASFFSPLFSLAFPASLFLWCWRALTPRWWDLGLCLINKLMNELRLIYGTDFKMYNCTLLLLHYTVVDLYSPKRYFE